MIRLKYLFLLFFSTFIMMNANAACSGNLQKYFDISDEYVSSHSNSYSCYDLYYLKVSGYSGITYSDYKKMYPQDSKEEGSDASNAFQAYDLNPAQANYIASRLDQKNLEYKAASIKKELDEMIAMDKSMQDVYSTSSGQFEKKNTIGTCSRYTFPEFNELSLAYKPYANSKGYFISAFSTSYAVVAPTKQSYSQAVFKFGQLEKTIPWDKGCYSDNNIMETLRTGCIFCHFYESMFDAISNYSYLLFDKLRETIFYLAMLTIGLFLAIDGFFGILAPTFGKEFFGEPLNMPELIKKYFGRFLFVGIFGIIFLPPHGSQVIPTIIDMITTPLFILTNYINEILMGPVQCDYGQAITNPGMLGSTFKQGYMCLAQVSFMTLLKPVGIGLGLIFSLSITKIVCGIILVYIFLKNLFNVALYLMSPLIQIGIRLLFLPITLFFEMVNIGGFKLYNMFDLWKYFVQMCFISIFTTFFTMFVSLLVGSIATPDKFENLEEYTYTGELFWELVIVGFLAGYILKQIPSLANQFSGYFGGATGINETFGDKIQGQAKSGVQEFTSTKRKFKKEEKFWTSDRTKNGMKGIWKNTKGFFSKGFRRR